MVSWGDGEDSSTDFSSDSSDGIQTMYDSQYDDSDDEEPRKRCKCRSVAGKFVAFGGYNTGRRFLGCQQKEGTHCDFVRWVDPVWPNHLGKCLGKIWEMYGNVKRGRTSDALEHMEHKFELNDEIERLHKDLRMAQDELQKAVAEKQVTLALKAMAEQALVECRSELEHKKIVEANHSNMHQVLRVKAEKDIDELKAENQKLKNTIAYLIKQKEEAKGIEELKAEKKKLEYIISDLLNQKEGFRAKLRKIREIADE